jgi:uncharacterized membrane protein/protein-disulfide isomerase
MTNNSQSADLNQKSWGLALAIAASGIAASLYSISHHMELRRNGHTEASCNINSVVNCDAVAASKYSEIFGIPLGVWGLGYFVAMAVLAVTIFAGHKSSKEHEPAWLIMAALGILTSVALAGISLGVLGTVCIVCVLIYALTLAQGSIAWSLWRKRRPKLDLSSKTIFGGISTAAIAVAITILGFNYLKPSHELPSELQDLPGKYDRGASIPQFAPAAIDIPINKSAYSGMGEDFRKGPDDAKIVIIEFADYMCPGCGQTAPILEDLHRQLGQRALLVFKNFPLSNQCNSSVSSDMHPYSCDIARLARCSGSIGKFWDYHLKAFAEQSRASKDKAREWGKEVGLTDAQMDQCLASNDILAKIRDDVDIANKAGVNSTPTIFVNGRKYLGERTTQAMRAAIESM